MGAEVVVTPDRGVGGPSSPSGMLSTMWAGTLLDGPEVELVVLAMGKCWVQVLLMIPRRVCQEATGNGGCAICEAKKIETGTNAGGGCWMGGWVSEREEGEGGTGAWRE